MKVQRFTRLDILTLLFFSVEVLASAQAGVQGHPPSGNPLAVADPFHVQPQIQPGWRFEVTRSAGIKGTLSAQGEPAYPVRYFSKIIFLEQVNKVKAGRISEVTREVITAERQMIDEESQQTGELSRYELAPKGQTF